MTRRTQAERQAAARQRKRRQQLLRIGAGVIALAIVTVGIMIAFTDDDADPVSPTRQTSDATTWDAGAFTGGPRLAVDRVTHDQGDIQYGEPVEASFRLRNIGDQPLELGDIAVNTLEGC